MTIQVISFDLDDTLWPILPVIQQAERTLHTWLQTHYSPIANRYNVDDLHAKRMALLETHPEFKTDFSRLRRHSLQLLVEEFGHGNEVAEAAYAVFHAARHQVTLYQDVLPVLEKLQKRYILCSLTNGTAEIEKTCLQPFFQHNLSVQHVGEPKPHPAMFNALSDKLSIHAEKIVHVGDDAVCDVDGAINYGMKGVWLNRHYRHWTGTQRPHATIRHLWALLDVLETWH